jgi:3-keto-5-aminohexanoate cleavage enzyme
VFEPGFLQVVLAYHEAGALPRGTLVKLYFAAGGYLTPGRPLWGAPPIPEALDLYLAMLGDSGIPWAVAVVGGDALAAPVTRLALERGGHLRVGIEDDQHAADNVALVQGAAALCAEVGRPVATQAEAVDLLALAPTRA